MKSKLKIISLIIWYLLCAFCVVGGIMFIVEENNIRGGISVFVWTLFLCICPFLLKLLIKAQKKWNSKSKIIQEPLLNEKQAIKTVKILGTRAGLETRVLGTYNFTIYSLLIVYKNGEREVVECESKSERFKELIKYIEVGTTSKQSDPLSIDEMIDMDEMND